MTNGHTTQPNPVNESDLAAKGFIRQSDGSWAKGKSGVGGVAQIAVPQPSDSHEPLATIEGKVALPIRRLVRVTCYRVRLLDDDNPYVKDAVDSLRHASLVFDDSPKWCKIEVGQVKADRSELERTIIEIENL